MPKENSSQSKFNFYVHGALPAYSNVCASLKTAQTVLARAYEARSARLRWKSLPQKVPFLGSRGKPLGGQQFFLKAREVSHAKTHHSYVWKPSAAQPSL